MPAADRFAERKPIEIKNYGSKGPWIRLIKHPDVKGRLVSEGPEQSMIKWTNGNETCAINEWIERCDDPKALRSTGGAVTGRIVSDGAHIEEIEKERPAPAPRPAKPKDDLGAKVSEHCGQDEAALVRFAKANGCWDDKYAKLPNPGLRRMNVVNRLRGKLKKDTAFKIKWED